MDWERDVLGGNVAELALTLFEESGDALFLFEPESERLLQANPMAQRLSGFSARELKTHPIDYFFRSQQPGGMARLRQAYLKTGLFHSQEGFLLRHRTDGHWVPVNLTVTRLHVTRTEPAGPNRTHTLGLITARDISERLQEQAQLRRVEAELRRVVSNVPVYIWSMDVEADGRWSFRYISPAVEKVTGWTPAFYQADLSNWWKTVYAEDRQRLAAAFARLLADRPDRSEQEYRVVRPDGAVRWMRDVITLGWGEGGTVARFDGVVADITERKQAEESVRRSEERFRALVEKSFEAFSLLSAEGRVTYASPSTTHVLGYTPQEIVGLTLFDLTHPDDLERTRELFAECLARPGVPVHAELRMRHQDGSWRVLEGTGTNRLEEPHLGGIVTNYRDVTERRRTEERVRTSEAKYRSLVENLEQCIFLKDRELRFVAANRRFCETVGRPESDVLGSSDADFYPPELATKYRADDLRVLASGQRLEMEEESLMDGRRCAVRVVKTPVLDDLGQTVGVLGIFWDVTEQRQLEEQLRQAQKMEAVGQLAGGVAHDFNNLLTAILGNVGLIQSHLPDGHGCGAWLAAVEKAAMRGAGLTRQMLGFSRRTVLRPSPIGLNAVVEEVLSLLVGVIDPRIVIETHLDAGDGGLVRGDAGLLHQMLLNLCLNARDAMPDGGRLVLETTDVTLTADDARGHLDARCGEFVRLRVSDTGHGIPPHVLPRIFDPFFTTKAPGKGTGLGLSVAYGIVRQHQGWVTCVSEPGAGTRFDVHLPSLGHAARPGEPDAPSPIKASALGGSRCTESVLLVDDEPFLRELGRTVLARCGYTVLTANDGVEAVEVFRSAGGRLDLVVMDLTMPRLSGLDAFRQIRSSAAGPVRVLFTSGHPSDGLDSLTSDPDVAFLPKPYRPENLSKSVRELLDRTP